MHFLLFLKNTRLPGIINRPTHINFIWIGWKRSLNHTHYIFLRWLCLACRLAIFLYFSHVKITAAHLFKLRILEKIHAKVTDVTDSMGLVGFIGSGSVATGLEPPPSGISIGTILVLPSFCSICMKLITFCSFSYKWNRKYFSGYFQIN